MAVAVGATVGATVGVAVGIGLAAAGRSTWFADLNAAEAKGQRLVLKAAEGEEERLHVRLE